MDPEKVCANMILDLETKFKAILCGNQNKDDFSTESNIITEGKIENLTNLVENENNLNKAKNTQGTDKEDSPDTAKDSNTTSSEENSDHGPVATTSNNTNATAAKTEEESEDKENYKKRKRNRYPPEAAKMFTSLKSLTEETCYALLEANDIYKQKDRVLCCCKDLESLFVRFRAYPIGSRILGLADAYSDLDVFLDMGNMYFGYTHQDAQSQEEVVCLVADRMRKNTNTWKQVVPIPHARTPIVKVYHKPSSLYCDVSFRHGLSFQNTQLIGYMMQILPVARPLIIILKKWLINSHLDQHIRSFTLSIMVIFYLQTRNFLPSIAALRVSTQEMRISGWECHYSTRPIPPGYLNNPPSFIELVYGFFYYYSSVFNYDTEVVCPLMGRTVLKSQFKNNGFYLPNEMQRYKIMVSQCTDEIRNQGRVSKFVADHPLKEVFRHDTSMCVQDPFDLSHNLMKAAQYTIVERFKTYCAAEAEKCDKIRRSSEMVFYNDTFWKY